MNHKKLIHIMAIITMVFVFSCKKEDNDTLLPVKQTVFAGMDVSRMVFYGNVTYSYTYDDDYRLLRIKEIQADDHFVIRDMNFTYGGWPSRHLPSR